MPRKYHAVAVNDQIACAHEKKQLGMTPADFLGLPGGDWRLGGRCRWLRGSGLGGGGCRLACGGCRFGFDLLPLLIIKAATAFLYLIRLLTHERLVARNRLLVKLHRMSSPQNYRIGVISDTHNRWVSRIAELFKDVDEIWHLGDVCDETILDELRVINTKLTVVLGNNDFNLDLPVSLDLERCGERFHLIHIFPRRVQRTTDWLLFGHTHRPADEMHDSVHLFNPGSAGLANKGAPLSVGFLTREKGAKFRASVVLL